MEAITQFFPNFLLVFCRISAFFVVAPVFSSRGVPATLKIGISFFVSLLVLLAMDQAAAIPWDGAYVLFIIRELLIGLLLGFTAYLFFTLVQIAGSFVDLQLGFGIANVIDPLTGAQSPLLGNLKYMLAMLLFLSINGHHYLLMAIMKSYEWIPFTNHLFAHMKEGDVSEFLLQAFAKTFYLAFQMSAPLVAALFLVDVGLGILAKTVPQINIFIVGISLKILVGFIMLAFMVTVFIFLFQNLFKTMFEYMNQLLEIISK